MVTGETPVPLIVTRIMHDAGEAVQSASEQLYPAPQTYTVIANFEPLTCQQSAWHSLSRFPG